MTTPSVSVSSTPLRVLLIEDSVNDAELIVRVLQRGGYQPAWERVYTAAALAAALARQDWEVITCDWVMPDFSAPEALAVLQQHGCDVPVIIISGEVGEEVAVSAMKAGAHDYVSKHKLTRLVPAIRRELREAEGRKIRRRAEAALRESEARLRTYFEQASDLIFTLDGVGRMTSVNRAACEAMGYSPDELLGRSPLELAAPDAQAPVRQALARVLAGKNVEQVEVEAVAKDGRRLTLEIRGRSIRDGARLVGTFHIARNITERKRAAADYARLHAAVEQAAELVMITDLSGAVVYANPACERITGYSRDELCRQPPGALAKQWYDAAVYERLVSTLQAGETWQGVGVRKRKDGGLAEVEVTFSPVRDGSGAIINYLGIGRDVTHERQIESQLRQAQKLEAIGRLAGGVAHDFNNQLTVIKGSAQLLLGGLVLDDSNRRHVERISATVDHGARLVRQLLTFGRHQPIERRPLDLSELINDMTSVLRLLLGEQIALNVQAAPRLWHVRADRVEIERLVMNLVVNASDALRTREAMPAATADMITIETANVERDAAAGGVAGALPAGHYVKLVVSDTGPGMPPEVRERIFEPFFTTKEPGKGTGLGLATVFGIVTQHGGRIECRSELERGTTFQMYFPRDEGGEVIPARTVASTASSSHGSCVGRTVLLAEDEDQVREVVQIALEESGYHVLSARAVEEALALTRTHGSRIDLLVTDLVMPGGSGHALAQSLSQRYPEMRVLFVSGYSPDWLNLAERPGARFLSKPFGLDELLGTVDELLAR